MHVYGCAHVSHVRIRRALVFVCFIQIQPGLALVEEKICLKKTEYRWHRWKNMPRLYPKGQLQNASLKQDQRYTTTQPEHTRVSVLCKQTYYYGSKQQEEAVPICSTTILYVRVSYCRCCRCIYVGYESVTGTCVNVLYTCQCQEMQQPFGCWHEYRTLRYNSGQCGPSWCKKSCYEESSARPLVSLNTAD